MTADFVVVGAGSAGCVVAAELARLEAGTVLILEAGPSENHPLVSMPFGLVWLMGSRRDWRFNSHPLAQANHRTIAIPRGKMIGGSGSINSMVWFRGCEADYDAWSMADWSSQRVSAAFDAVEAIIAPERYDNAHPLSEGLSTLFTEQTPTPERESAGLLHHNMRNGLRFSAANGFLRQQPGVQIRSGVHVDRLIWKGDRAVGVLTDSGESIYANKGVVLSAGAIMSPSILMRSGVGHRDDLTALGIDTRLDQPLIGQNLHDHPGIGLHHEGTGSGYGLEPSQWLQWMLAPFQYWMYQSGRLASPTVEAGAFFNARAENAPPDVQTHFIPFFLAHRGSRYQMKSGYFADVCLCRPKSRGQLRLVSKRPERSPQIDLGLFNDQSDLETLQIGIERLRTLLQDADFGSRRAPEVFPGPNLKSEALQDHIRANAGTAYHPVGTVAMGNAPTAPLSPKLAVNGTRNLWVADASVMPSITSANTNAPSMMIGYKGAEFISQEAA